MEERELKTIVESILFAATEPLSLERLREILEGVERREIATVLETIREDLVRNDHGIQLVETGGGYQFATVPGSEPWVRRLGRMKAAPKLSKAALEVLAIIAYRPGVTRPEIEAIRGVDSGGVIRLLMERRLVKIVGRKETVGRPLMYGSTKEFLHAFGLNDLGQLPSLKEFKELTEGEMDSLSLTAADGNDEMESTSALASPPMAYSEGAGDAP